MVDFEGREGIVMHDHDVFALEKASGTNGVIDIHGQSAADAQDGKFEFGSLDCYVPALALVLRD